MYLVMVKCTHVHRKTKKIKKAIVDSKTQEIGLQSLLCTVGNFILYIFFSEAWTLTNPKVI